MESNHAAYLRLAILTSAAASPSACSIPREFACEEAAQCVRDDAQGHCEPTGWCSFDDDTCTSRRRYAEEVSGELSGECVLESIPLWITTIGGGEDDRVSALSVDGGGNPIVGGTFRGRTTGEVVVSSQGDADVLLAALDGATGATRWSLAGGGPARDELGAVSFSGGVLSVGGSVTGAITLGDRQTDASGAGTSAFLARLTASEADATVDLLFASSGDADEQVVAIADSVWVGDYRGGQVAFSPGDTHPPSGALDLWAGVWAPTENTDPIWSDAWGGVGNDRVTAAAVAMNQLTIVGAFEQSLPVVLSNPTRTTTLVADGGSDGFLLRLQASGAPTGRSVVFYAERLGGAGDDAIHDVLVSAEGGVVIAGTFAASVDFGAGPVAARGATDAFVQWRDTGRVWHAGGAGGAATACCIAEGPDGDVLVAGTFEGMLDLGGLILQASGQTDVFVARLGPDGDVEWAASFGGPGLDAAAGVEVSAADDVYVAATFAETAEIGGVSVTATGGTDWAVLAVRRR